MATHKLTKPIIEAAILGFESQRARLAEQIAELRVMLDGRPAEAAATSEAPTRKRRKFQAWVAPRPLDQRRSSGGPRHQCYLWRTVPGKWFRSGQRRRRPQMPIVAERLRPSDLVEGARP